LQIKYVSLQIGYVNVQIEYVSLQTEVVNLQIEYAAMQIGVANAYLVLLFYTAVLYPPPHRITPAKRFNFHAQLVIDPSTCFCLDFAEKSNFKSRCVPKCNFGTRGRNTVSEQGIDRYA